MRKLAKSEMRLLLVFSAAVFLALNLLAMRGWMNHRSGVMASISQTRSAIDTAQGWLLAAEALRPAREWVEKNPSPVTTEEAANTNLLNTVRALAEKSNLKMLEETLLPGEGDAAILQAKINGPFSGVAAFLFELQNPTAWRAVDKMGIRSDSEPPNVVVDMEIRQHYRSQAPASSPANP